jgi:hypothetical protein
MDPDNEDAEVFFDYMGGFIDEETAVVSTVESDEEFGAGRHWIIDLKRMRVADRLTYPFSVPGLPQALGDGTWFTVPEAQNTVHVWAL